MATIFTGYRNYTRFYLSWDVVQQDIANNRSLINWTAGIQAQPGWSPYWGTNAVRINSVYIDGQGNLASGTWSNITLNNGATLPLRSGSVWIGHNGDGTKSFGVSISGWLFANGDLNANGSMTAPTIPRNSQVTTNKTSYTLGESITVYTNRKSGSFNHAITLRDNATNTLLASFNNIGDSVTWTPQPADITKMQQLIPNTNRLNVRVDQWNNNIGQGSNTVVALNLTDANPIFTDFTYADSNAAVVAITGDNQVLVRGQSTLQTTISVANKMQAVKYANPARYSVVYDGTTDQKPYSDTADVISTFTAVDSIGQRTIVATAIDSRGNNTSVSKSVTVYDYADPTIESTLERENNFGTDTTLHLEGTWTPLTIGGTAKNSLLSGTLKYRYKEDGGSYGSWTTRNFTVTGDKWAISSDVVISLDNTKKYVFEFQLSDRFKTVYGEGSVDVGKPIMFVGEMGDEPAVGIGKTPAQAGLDVVGPIYSDGNKVAFGGWDQIARFNGTVNTTTKSITFAPYKYIKIVVRSIQTSSGTAQQTIRLKLGSPTNTGTRTIGRITSAGVMQYSTGSDNNGMIAAVSRGSGNMSYFETEMYVTGQFGGDLMTYSLHSADPDWNVAWGQYFQYVGTAQMSPLSFYSSAGTYNAEITVYGHN